MSLSDDIFELEEWLKHNAPKARQKEFASIVEVLADYERENMRLEHIKSFVGAARRVIYIYDHDRAEALQEGRGDE